MPLGSQKAFLGTFPPPKHCKIRAFRKEKTQKRRKKGGGSKNNDSATKKKSSFGNRGAYAGRWFGAGFFPRSLQNLKKNKVFTCLSSGSGGVPWGTHARARGNAFYVLRTVRRAAEGEPPRLEGGVPVHRKTFILVASTVSHSPAFPR